MPVDQQQRQTTRSITRTAQRRRWWASATTLAVLLGTAGLTGASTTPAAAGPLVARAVTTTVDAALTSGCADGDGATLSLREALCQAAAAPGSPSQITLPSGTITLTAGELVFNPGTAVVLTITGAAARTTIDAHGASRVLDIDLALVGGVDVTVENVVLTGGKPNDGFGGGAILSGTAGGAVDSLTVRNSALTNNTSDAAANPGATGGAIMMAGGKLVVDGTTFTGNQGNNSPGGAVSYTGTSAASDTVVISNSSFTGNSTSGSGGTLVGGAVYLNQATTATITGSRFTGNAVTNTSGDARGAAIHSDSPVTITGSVVRSNTVTGTRSVATTGGALWLAGGSVTQSQLGANSVVAAGSTTADVVRWDGASRPDLTKNWWGCSTTPTTGCGLLAGNPDVGPSAVLAVATTPTAAGTGDTITATATVVMTDGSTVPAALRTALVGLPVVWTATSGGVGAAPSSVDSSGVATATHTMGTVPTVYTATADAVSASATVDLSKLPGFTTDLPATTAVQEGSLPQLAVAANGAPDPTIAWFVSTDNGLTWTATGSTGTTLTLPAVQRTASGTMYRAVATNPLGTATSTATTIDVLWGPTVTTAPVGRTVTSGDAATFTVAAQGSPTPTYRWQTSVAGAPWTDVTGGTSATLTLASTSPADDGTQVRAVVTSGAASVTTTPVTLHVQYVGTVTGVSDTTVAEGQIATFTALDLASNAGAGSWSWETQAPGSSTWASVPSATSPTLSIPTSRTLDGARYRATATHTADDGTVLSATSATATLTVLWGPVVTQDPSSVSREVGQTATFTTAAQGNPAPSVQWQTSSGGAWTDVSGATATTYTRTVTPGDDGLMVRAVATGGPAGPAITGTAVITIVAPAAIVTAPQDTEVIAGSTASFSVVVSGAPTPTVTWQSSTDGTTWTTVTGASGTTLTVPTSPATNGTQYRAVATNSLATVMSAPAHLSVLWATTATAPADVTTAPGASVSFRSTVSGNPTPTVRWCYSRPLDGTATIEADGSLTVVPTIKDDGVEVTACPTQLWGGAPVTTTSAAATLSVIAVPTVVTSPNAVATVTAGNPLTVSWVVAAVGGTATWQASTDGGTTWGALPSGATTSQAPVTPAAAGAAPSVTYQVTLAPTLSQNGLRLRLTVANATGSVVTTPVRLEVAAPAVTPTATPSATPTSSATGQVLSTTGSKTVTSTSTSKGSKSLAWTGTTVMPLLVIAGAAIIAGGLLLVLRRRRMRTAR